MCSYLTLCYLSYKLFIFPVSEKQKLTSPFSRSLRPKEAGVLKHKGLDLILFSLKNI